MEERRKFLRQQTSLRGVLYFNHHASTIECEVRDISMRGARLMLPQGAIVPDKIELFIAQTVQHVRGQVLWRHGNEIGFVFTSAIEVEAENRENAELAMRMRMLEQELDGLKRMVRHMHGETPGKTEAA